MLWWISALIQFFLLWLVLFLSRLFFVFLPWYLEILYLLFFLGWIFEQWLTTWNKVQAMFLLVAGNRTYKVFLLCQAGNASYATKETGLWRSNIKKGSCRTDLKCVCRYFYLFNLLTDKNSICNRRMLMWKRRRNARFRDFCNNCCYIFNHCNISSLPGMYKHFKNSASKYDQLV